jgi:NAD(P)-dependent dehydrogenase (short-subunit alcohol dehydrogenase family)
MKNRKEHPMVVPAYDFSDHVIVVTGGSRGIGLEIARELISRKATVVICGRKMENLEAAANEIGGHGRLRVFPAHIAKPEQVDALFGSVIENFGRVDGLVNNVGMNVVTPTVDADPTLWNKIIDSNLNGTFLCSRKAGQLMRKQRRGKIVSISSLAAHRAAPAMGIYGIAKAGIEMMGKVLAQELAPFNIQVNTVAPGMVRTKFSEPFWSNADFYKEIVKGIPMGRIAEPADVVKPVLFFLSGASDFITGQTLAVDGGASAI